MNINFNKSLFNTSHCEVNKNTVYIFSEVHRYNNVLLNIFWATRSCALSWFVQFWDARNNFLSRPAFWFVEPDWPRALQSERIWEGSALRKWAWQNLDGTPTSKNESIGLNKGIIIMLHNLLTFRCLKALRLRYPLRNLLQTFFIKAHL